MKVHGHAEGHSYWMDYVSLHARSWHGDTTLGRGVCHVWVPFTHSFTPRTGAGRRRAPHKVVMLVQLWYCV